MRNSLVRYSNQQPTCASDQLRKKGREKQANEVYWRCTTANIEHHYYGTIKLNIGL